MKTVNSFSPTFMLQLGILRELVLAHKMLDLNSVHFVA